MTDHDDASDPFADEMQRTRDNPALLDAVRRLGWRGMVTDKPKRTVAETINLLDWALSKKRAIL